ncbi:Uma2 family endonuclease [Bradyrhizobium australafricanum]|uniref:Uma2 family endonuclease n=1 Tax=Bradyrhizobium australafricanum TaxID=2821406 RepID=UPI001CE254A0|nr:Uma2 family endonuclease [Bradyrhizobium australafricanum]
MATASATRRMSDLGVDCGNPADDSLEADEPTMVVEVLSPTNEGFEVTLKLAE